MLTLTKQAEAVQVQRLSERAPDRASEGDATVWTHGKRNHERWQK